MLVYGEVTGVRGEEIIVKVPKKDVGKVLRCRQGKTLTVELRVEDGRTRTPEQRKKYFATVDDIADHLGDISKCLHSHFKDIYCSENGVDEISMENCSVTAARELINIVMDYAIENYIPLHDFGLNRTDDIDRYLYSCLVNRRCCICGKPADIHHVTGYRIGMGMDRDKVNHVGRKAIALCRIHHNIAHMKEKDFFDKWKIYGITLDEYTVELLGL